MWVRLSVCVLLSVCLRVCATLSRLQQDVVDRSRHITAQHSQTCRHHTMHFGWFTYITFRWLKCSRVNYLRVAIPWYGQSRAFEVHKTLKAPIVSSLTGLESLQNYLRGNTRRQRVILPTTTARRKQPVFGAMVVIAKTLQVSISISIYSYIRRWQNATKYNGKAEIRT